jgi:hypothetical protein
MGTNETHRQFDDIVTHLTEAYPSLAGRPRRSRKFLITAAVVGGLLWGLLSVAMVAWGAAGVVLTCVVAALTVTGIVVDVRGRPGG